MSSKPRVYVGRLHPKARERDLEKFFRGYGKISDIMMKRGFAFVEFEDVRDADDAVRDLDGKELLGDRLVIEMAHGLPRGPGGRIMRDERDRDRDRGRDRYRDDRDRGRDRYDRRDSSRRGPPQRTDHRLYCENLSSRCSWQDLKDFMRRAGEVTYAEKIGSSTGVVEFASSSHKRAALRKLDGEELLGKRIKLRESSRSRSRSRDRSRSPLDKDGDRKRRTKSRSRSGSASPRKDSKTNGTADDDGGKRRTKSKSRSRSGSRSASLGSDRRGKEENGTGGSPKDAKDDDEGLQSRSRTPSHSRENSEDADRGRRGRRGSGDNSKDDGPWDEAEDD